MGPEGVTGMLVGVTVLVAVIIICFLVMCTKPLQRRTARRRRASKEGPGEYTYESLVPQELEVRPAELEITLVEMEGTRMCSEMPVATERRVRNEDLDELVS